VVWDNGRERMFTKLSIPPTLERVGVTCG